MKSDICRYTVYDLLRKTMNFLLLFLFSNVGQTAVHHTIFHIHSNNLDPCENVRESHSGPFDELFLYCKSIRFYIYTSVHL